MTALLSKAQFRYPAESRKLPTVHSSSPPPATHHLECTCFLHLYTVLKTFVSLVMNLGACAHVDNLLIRSAAVCFVGGVAEWKGLPTPTRTYPKSQNPET